MFANLKKKLNVDATGAASDSQPSSPAMTAAAAAAGSSPMPATPRRLLAQSERGGTNDALGMRHANSVPVTPASNSSTEASCMSKRTDEADVTSVNTSLTLSSPRESQPLASDPLSAAAGEERSNVGHRKDAENKVELGSGAEQIISASEQATVQQELASGGALASTVTTPPRPGERARLLELLNKKSDQLRALEFKVEEQAVAIRDRESAVQCLEARFRTLHEEHEEQCRHIRSECETRVQQAEATYRDQLTKADRQCAETVLAAEEKCRAQAADDLRKVTQELSLCKEELHRRDREADQLRALVNETASTASVHSAELAARDELVMQLQAEKQSLADTNETITSELCAFRDKLKVLHLQVNTLETELVKKNEQVDALEKLTGELQSIRNRLERDLRAVQDGSSHVGPSGMKDADAEMAVLKKVTDLEEVVREAEKRERALSNLLQEKDAALESLHRQLEEARIELVARESNFSSRLTEMADEHRANKKAFYQERTVLLEKIAGLEASHDESLERQIEGERRLSESEQELAVVRRTVAERDESLQRLAANAEAAVGAQARLAAEVNRLQAETRSKDIEFQRISLECQEKQMALDRLQNEYDDSCKRNAEIARQLADLTESTAGDTARLLADHCRQLEERDAEQRRLANELQRLAAAAEAADRSATAASDELQLRSAEVAELRERARLSDSQTAELEAARRSVRDLEEQLAEKGKALRLQQQHVNDLKKALQKNLKSTVAPLQPPVTHLPSASASVEPSLLQSQQQPQLQQRPPSPPLSSSGRLQPSPTQQMRDDAAVCGRFASSGNSDSEILPEAIWPSSRSSVGDQSRPIGEAALIAGGTGAADGLPLIRRNNLTSPALAGGSASPQITGPRPPAPAAGQGIADDPDSWNLCSSTGAEHAAAFTDVNFKYLRNVVLKFLVCREAEAVQLVKAIAVLLRLSPQEEKLLKDTLEYRMSWFGPRPQLKAK